MREFDTTLKKDLTAEEFARFRDWIHEHSGIYVEDCQLDSLRISLVTRATRFDLNAYDAYYEMLVADEDEFKALMNLVTINETSFFRFPAQFEALRDLVIPDVLASKSRLNPSFRVWSAGCSTGEEPYSIAMTLLDSAVASSGYRPEVLGTDVSTQALERAKDAVYPTRALEAVQPDAVLRWFDRTSDQCRPRQAVRDIVDLRYHNLVREPYPTDVLGGFDIIFCRNVTIYFRVESTRRVIDHFFEALNPGGSLFIGHSETLSSITDRFEVVELNGVFVYRKPDVRRHYSAVAKTTSLPARARAKRSLATVAASGAASSARRVCTAGATRSVEAAAAASGELTPSTPAPSRVDVLLLEARELLDAGRSADACSIAERVLAEEPRNTRAMLISAYTHADAGDFSAAMAQANAALRIDPLLAEARYILGIIRQRQGDTESALAEFRRTIYIDHEFVLAHFSAANLYRARGALDEAAREYENTLRALYVNPVGSWTVFLGGFRPDLLAKTCERGLLECRKGS